MTARISAEPWTRERILAYGVRMPGVTACEVIERNSGSPDGGAMPQAAAVPGGNDCVASRKTPATM